MNIIYNALRTAADDAAAAVFFHVILSEAEQTQRGTELCISTELSDDSSWETFNLVTE